MLYSWYSKCNAIQLFNGFSQIVGKMSYWGSSNQGSRRSLSPIRGGRERGRSGRTAEKFVNPEPSRSYPGINPPKPQLIGAASKPASSSNSTYQNAPPPLFPSAASITSKSSKEHLQQQPRHQPKETSEQQDGVAEQLFPPGKTSDLQIRLNKTPNQLYIGMNSDFLSTFNHQVALVSINHLNREVA